MNDHGQERVLADAYRKLKDAARRSRSAERRAQETRNEQHAASADLSGALALIAELEAFAHEAKQLTRCVECGKTIEREEFAPYCSNACAIQVDHSKPRPLSDAVAGEIDREVLGPEYAPTADACREDFTVNDVRYVCMKPRGHNGDHKGTATILIPTSGKIDPVNAEVLNREFGKLHAGSCATCTRFDPRYMNPLTGEVSTGYCMEHGQQMGAADRCGGYRPRPDQVCDQSVIADKTTSIPITDLDQAMEGFEGAKGKTVVTSEVVRGAPTLFVHPNHKKELDAAGMGGQCVATEQCTHGEVSFEITCEAERWLYDKGRKDERRDVLTIVDEHIGGSKMIYSRITINCLENLRARLATEKTMPPTNPVFVVLEGDGPRMEFVDIETTDGKSARIDGQRREHDGRFLIGPLYRANVVRLPAVMDERTAPGSEVIRCGECDAVAYVVGHNDARTIPSDWYTIDEVGDVGGVFCSTACVDAYRNSMGASSIGFTVNHGDWSCGECGNRIDEEEGICGACGCDGSGHE